MPALCSRCVHAVLQDDWDLPMEGESQGLPSWVRAALALEEEYDVLNEGELVGEWRALPSFHAGWVPACERLLALPEQGARVCTPPCAGMRACAATRVSPMAESLHLPALPTAVPAPRHTSHCLQARVRRASCEALQASTTRVCW